MTGRADYQDRQEARAERLTARAAKLRSESHAAHDQAQKLASYIPFGQPILVGHYSERRHRGDLTKINRLHERAFEAQDAAHAAERSLAAMASGRAISSDDPEARDRLRAKLAGIEAARAQGVAVNKAIRAAKGDNAKALAALQALGLPAQDAVKLLTPDFCGRIGVAAYQLTNWSAEARRIQQRIASLDAQETAPAKADETIGAVTIREADNRVQMLFPGKPSEALRAQLKRNGFRWSPLAGAWQRMPGEWSWTVARQIATEAKEGHHVDPTL